ncbi:hypothetical protein FRC02_002706 [Tulasnella sp. 418]|nr:hypothetical protein FRC02_002706 [Tulasnella sp. 418]
MFLSLTSLLALSALMPVAFANEYRLVAENSSNPSYGQRTIRVVGNRATTSQVYGNKCTFQPEHDHLYVNEAR